MRHETLDMIACPACMAFALVAEQAQEHAKVFCGRAGIVNVTLPDGSTRGLCGSDRDHFLLHYDDVVDLLARMNTEATRQGWAFFSTVHPPRFAFAVPALGFPANAKEADLRKWLASQEAVKKGSVSPAEGALIHWARAAKQAQ